MKVSVKDLVEELFDTFSNMASAKNILFINHIADDLELFVDENTTRTIMRNVVNNAIKFTPENGEVSVAAYEEDTFIAVRVSDTGIGMSEDKLQALFNFQHKSAYGTAGEKGLGLGLQLVYEFVEMNRGAIEVKSEEGEGTEFTIRLPLFESELVAVESEK